MQPTQTQAPDIAAASAASPAIKTHDLTRRFGQLTALDRVSVSIRKGEFFSLLGPSGCGKTTLLRIIAGLDLPDSGQLEIHGESALELPAHRRPVNTVFQSYALFPHMTVRDNVAFGLRMKGIAPAEIDSRVRRVMELVEISSLAERKPAQISGGQKQRVALARAIVNEPEVLLLDEPLGALDLKLRKQLQRELHLLQRRLGVTFVYVTHDQDEAMVMSDRIAVMNAGRIEQLGPPQEIYEKPRTRFVADFLGSCNFVRAQFLRRGDSHVPTKTNEYPLIAQSPLGELNVISNQSADGLIGKTITLTIRPEKILIATSPANGSENQITARVEEVTFSGAETHLLVSSSGQELRVTVVNQADATAWRVGQQVSLTLPPGALKVLED